MVLEFFMIFRTTPTFFRMFSQALPGEERVKGGVILVPQSNISYKTIKSNKTLFECVGEQKSEAENEEE